MKASSNDKKRRNIDNSTKPPVLTKLEHKASHIPEPSVEYSKKKLRRKLTDLTPLSPPETIQATRSVLFGEDSSLKSCLGDSGSTISTCELSPLSIGYQVGKVWYPSRKIPSFKTEKEKNRVKTLLKLNNSHRPLSACSLTKNNKKEEDLDYSADERPFLLESSQLLELIETEKMPLGLINDKFSPSRSAFSSQVSFNKEQILFIKRQERKMNEDELREYTQRNDPEDDSCYTTGNLTKVKDEAKFVESEEKGYKKHRLNSIINVPLEDSLSKEYKLTKEIEQRLTKKMHQEIIIQWQKLPLKFLFELPDGVAYCRKRLTSAFNLWIRAFEVNQLHLAWLQWIALVESRRYQLRKSSFFKRTNRHFLRKAVAIFVRVIFRNSFIKWSKAVRLLIWLERNRSAIKIQVIFRCYLGYKKFIEYHREGWLRDGVDLTVYRKVQFSIPLVVRLERNQKWNAAILIQSFFRQAQRRKRMYTRRKAVIRLQSTMKMKIAYRQYHQILRHISLIQSGIRRYICRCSYKKIRRSILLLQARFRGYQERQACLKRFYERMYAMEIQLNAGLTIQRYYRNYCRTKIIIKRKEEKRKQFLAALKIQKMWYQRNGEWSTLLLLSCLRETSNDDQEIKKQEHRAYLHLNAKKIQRRFRTFLLELKYSKAVVIQCCFRSYFSKKKLKNRRERVRCQRKIGTWGTIAFRRRQHAARTIQFWWLKADPQRYSEHLLYLKNKQYLIRMQEEEKKKFEAATRIQAFLSKIWSRLSLKQSLSNSIAAKKIQRRYRQYLKKKVAYQLLLKQISIISNAFISEMLIEVVYTLSRARKIILGRASIKIQCSYRGWKCRYLLRKNWIKEALEHSMAKRIQHNLKSFYFFRLAKKLISSIKRSRNSPFLADTTVNQVLHRLDVIYKKIYDPYDEKVGMSVQIVLRRLACEEYAELFHKSGYRTFEDIKQLSDFRLIELGIADKRARDRILALTEDEAAKVFLKRSKIKLARFEISLNYIESSQGKLNDTIQLNRSKKEKLSQDLLELQQETEGLRHIPKALKSRLDSSTAQLIQIERIQNELDKDSNSIETTRIIIQKQIEDLKIQINQVEEKKLILEEFLVNFFPPKDKLEIQQMFRNAFPGHETKSLTFSDAFGSIKSLQISRFQIIAYLSEFASSSAKASAKDARDKVKLLLLERNDVKYTQIYDRNRNNEFIEAHLNAFERLFELLKPEEIDLLSEFNTIQQNLVQKLHKILLEATRTPLTQLPIYWRCHYDSIVDINKKAIVIQRKWRKHHQSILKAQLHQAQRLKQIKNEYKVHQMTKNVRNAWEKERQLEFEQYLEFEKERKLQVLETLLKGIYRWNRTDNQMHYTIEEDTQTRKIQSTVRLFISRKKRKALLKEIEKKQSLERERELWSSRKAERDRFITIRISYKNIDAEELDRWKEAIREREINTALSSKQDNTEKLTTKGTISKLDELYNQFNTSIHSSATCPFEHATKLNASLHYYSVLRKHRIFQTKKILFELSYTKVQARYPWIEVQQQAVEGVNVVYFHPFTRRLSNIKPCYTFEETKAVELIARCFLSWLGKKKFRDEIKRQNLVDLVHRAIEQVSSLGWIGYGLEGMNLEMYLVRCGLSNLFPLLNSKLTNLLKLHQMQKNELIALGISSNDAAYLLSCPQSISQRFPLSPKHLDPLDKKNVLSFPSSREKIQELLLSAFPNQMSRCEHMLTDICTSITPISNGQIKQYLSKYKGRAKVAQDQIKEILNLTTVSSEQQEKKCYSLLLDVSRQIVTQVRFYQLLYLHKNIQEALKLAEYSLRQAYQDEDKDLVLQNALKNCWTKGLWERKENLSSYALAAYILRNGVLELILRWIYAVEVVQKYYKGHLRKVWYLNLRRKRNDATILLQCFYRTQLAKRYLSLLRKQKSSIWEEFYSEKAQKSYYYCHTTEETLWHPPMKNGSPIPYRPLVKHYATGKIISSWPSRKLSTTFNPMQLEKQTSNSNESRTKLCHICRISFATRRCKFCIREGRKISHPKDYCFACFEFEHQNPDKRHHTFDSINNKLVADALICVECNNLAIKKCYDCDDNYCSNCFIRLHQHGKRALHITEEFKEGIAACIQCEENIATKLCDICKDALCEDCVLQTHSKGRKADHPMTSLRQNTQNGQKYCQLCDYRVVQSVCPFCSKGICLICNKTRHKRICNAFKEVSMQQGEDRQRCAECGKPATRICDVCGDIYCSEKWFGNDGCFEIFHCKGKRSKHSFSSYVPPIMQVKSKSEKKVNIQKEELESAKELKIQKLVQAAAAANTELQNSEKNIRQKYCKIQGCSELVYQHLLYCPYHCTPQRMLEETNDITQAVAQIIEAEKERNIREKNKKKKWKGDLSFFRSSNTH